jgi:predicted transcriptional regulator
LKFNAELNFVPLQQDQNNQVMDLQAKLKAGLHEMIEQIRDVNVLQAVYVILEREKLHEENIESNKLDAALDASLERGLKQIENGETIPHEEIKKRYARWLE